MKVSEKNKILFARLNTVDIQYLLNQFPEENAKTRALQNEIRAGGPATNAAIACAYLGSDTDLFTPIGEHTLSEFLRNELKNYGVQVLDPISGLPGKFLRDNEESCNVQVKRMPAGPYTIIIPKSV